MFLARGGPEASHLRKAILRASGFKALHDEDAIYAEEVAVLKAAGEEQHGIDPLGFTVSFKGVLLERLEVAFVVVTFGGNQHNVPLAVIAAIVVAAGAVAHAPRRLADHATRRHRGARVHRATQTAAPPPTHGQRPSSRHRPWKP